LFFHIIYNVSSQNDKENKNTDISKHEFPFNEIYIHDFKYLKL